MVWFSSKWVKPTTQCQKSQCIPDLLALITKNMEVTFEACSESKIILIVGEGKQDEEAKDF